LFFILPLICALIFAQDYWLTKIINNIVISVIAGVILIVFMYVILLKFNASCPNCKKGFAIHEIDRELIIEKRLGKKRIENIKVTYECRFCKYQIPLLEINEEELEQDTL